MIQVLPRQLQEVVVAGGIVLVATTACTEAQSADGDEAAVDVTDLARPGDDPPPALPSEEHERIDSVDWGPLAVRDAHAAGGHDAHGGSGRLDIGERCVTLEDEGGRSTTLVWRGAQVRWDEDDRQVVFERWTNGEELRLGHGAVISVGGVGQTDPPGYDWLAAPAERCPDRSFQVHDLRVHRSAE